LDTLVLLGPKSELWWLSEDKGEIVSELLCPVLCTTVFAQQCAHQYEQFLSLYWYLVKHLDCFYVFFVKVYFVFLCVFRSLIYIFMCFCVSLDHFVFVFSKLLLLSFVFLVPSQEIGW